MPGTRNIYLKIEPIGRYSPVEPQDIYVPPVQYRRDCMRNTGHEDGTIPAVEVAARSLTALVYREYLDSGYLIPKVDKLVAADINEPLYNRRVPGTVIYTEPGETLRIHVYNEDISPHSFHLHGLDYGIDSDGAWPFGLHTADNRRSDEICAGQEWTYTFRATREMVGAWPFHDHTRQTGTSVNRGLFGGIVVLPEHIKPPGGFQLPKPFLDLPKQIGSLQKRKSIHFSALNKKSNLLLERSLDELREQLLGGPHLFPKPERLLHVPVFFHQMVDHEAKPLFDSGDLEDHVGVYEHTFEEAGSFDYFCTIHPDMMGTVEVVSGGDPNPTVTIVDSPQMMFLPPDGPGTPVRVAVNGTVRWENHSRNHHTVTSVDGSAMPTHCINGRGFVGNSPTIVAEAGQRIRWYVFNLDFGHNWHNFHTHAMRWNLAGENFDVRSMGPAESFVVETEAPNVLLETDDIRKIKGPKNRPGGAKLYHLKGDFIFHCHVHHHLMNGMVGVVRSKQAVWLTPEMAEQIAHERGLPLDDGGNGCPEVDLDRCKKMGEGRWEKVPGEPGVTMMHSALLPNSSKVLFFGYEGHVYDPLLPADNTDDLPNGVEYSRLWNPDTGEYTPTQNQLSDLTPGGYLEWSLWSSEHTFLDTPEGTLLAHGGYRNNLKKAYLFNPATETWSPAGPTAVGRFYSTTITLGDRRALTLFGSDFGRDPGTPTSIEIYDPAQDGWPDTWDLSAFDYMYYPWTYQLPSGNLFVSGPQGNTRVFDPARDHVNDDPVLKLATRQGDRVRSSGSSQQGTSVLLPLRPPNYEARVIIAGGQVPSPQPFERIKTAEIINLGDPNPQWSYIGEMSFARDQLTSVLLPDGRVFIAGGMYGAGDGGPCEIFDPENPDAGWEMGPVMEFSRIYHSSILLLADGSVLAGGDPRGNSAPTPHERYFPEYFFRPRPSIGNAPGTVNYGVEFTIDTPQASLIKEVILMRPGAVTHGFNMSQRAIECEITGGGNDTLAVQSPPHGNIAPPGWHLLFIIDGNRTPSVGRWIRLTP